MIGIGEIKKLRTKLKLTQAELAQKAGVSQALVARIELGTVDPRYSTLRRIYETLKNEEKVVLYAEDLMSSPVEFVLARDTVNKAVNLMRKNEISQLPVLKTGINAGSVSESEIMKKFYEIGSGVEKLRVEEIMEKPFPLLSKKETFDAVAALLQSNNAVLVQDEKGNICGIITKADVLKHL